MVKTHWPEMERLVARLFSSCWQDLLQALSKLENAESPGVYLLAYKGKHLLGEKVREKDVFYVGMSHAGVSQRLKQFLNAIEKGVGHSAGNRFYRERTKRQGYRKMRSKKSFFVAFLPIPCDTEKRTRQAEDLRKMGLVAALEYYALARIRRKNKREPKLNRQ